MEKEQKLSEKEIKALGAKNAKITLNDPIISSLAAIYFLEQSEGFSEKDRNLMHNVMYNSILNSKQGSAILSQFLLKSRKNGKRYTGSISELGVLEEFAQNYEENLHRISPQGLAEVMGLKTQIGGEYGKVSSFGDLAKKNPEAYKTFYKTHMDYFLESKLSEANQMDLSMKKKNLEDTLSGAEPEQENIRKAA